MITPYAFGQETKDKPVLEQILDLMLQRGQIDREQYNALQEKAKKEHPTTLQTGIENGRPFVQSADGNVRFDVGGRLQVDFDWAEEGARTLTGTPLGNQFLVRRARLEVNGQFFRWIDLRIETDFTDSQPLRDAYLDLKFVPEFRLRVGQFKAPFSLEELTSDLHIDFVERSLVNELAPSFDRGIMAYGSVARGIVSYSVGGFNGSGQNTSDNNGAKDVAARLVIAPFKTSENFWLKGLQVAGNVTWGDESNLPSAQGRTEARTPNRFVYFAAQQARGDRLRYGTDLAWLVGPAAVKFEYDIQTNERRELALDGGNLAKLRARGWYASATYLLTGEEKRLSAPVVPARPFAPIAGQWGPGAWELGFRYATLNFRSDDLVNFFDGGLSPNDLIRIPGAARTGTAENGAEAFTVGISWYPNAQTRLMFNSTTYRYDNAAGTPYSCSPTSIVPTCTSANLGDLRQSHTTSWELLSRLQFWW
jgi:phosphate-selective porin OprO/OprP